MTAQVMTPLEIRQAGLQALARELGTAGMIRFLQQLETGAGDYSTERHQWLPQLDVETLAKHIKQDKSNSNRTSNIQ